MPIFALIFAYLGRFLLTAVSIKALLITLAVTVLPDIINNSIYDLLEIMQTSAQASYDAHATATGAAVVQLSEFGAWFANEMRIPEFLSIILAGAGAKFALKFSLLRFAL